MVNHHLGEDFLLFPGIQQANPKDLSNWALILYDFWKFIGPLCISFTTGKGGP